MPKLTTDTMLAGRRDFQIDLIFRSYLKLVFKDFKASVTRYRIRIGVISILGVFQSCLLLKLSIFDVFV